MREDAGGPVLLGHKQQHLIIDEVPVLLERAPQAQLQGLPNLCAGRREAKGRLAGSQCPPPALAGL